MHMGAGLDRRAGQADGLAVLEHQLAAPDRAQRDLVPGLDRRQHLQRGPVGAGDACAGGQREARDRDVVVRMQDDQRRGRQGPRIRGGVFAR